MEKDAGLLYSKGMIGYIDFCGRIVKFCFVLPGKAAWQMAIGRMQKNVVSTPIEDVGCVL